MGKERVALIIASYQYDDEGLRRLVAPPQDAEALARVLSDVAIGGFEVQTLLNEPSYKVTQEIEEFFDNRKRDDLLLIYFSCHGVKDEDGLLYFATPNTRLRMLRSTAIASSFINDVMIRSHSRRQVLLLDCCYSGAFARGMWTKADKNIATKEHFAGRGRVVLTASDAMQYSFEGDAVEGTGISSIFTRTLVRGLETGEADLNGDGQISLDELYDFVHDHVVDETPQQRPGKWAFDVQGDITIARNPRPIAKPDSLPIELRQAVESPFASVREGAVRELERVLRGSHLGQALAAEEALKQLTDDDSRRVSTAAVTSLAAYGEGKGGGPRADQERFAGRPHDSERDQLERAVTERSAQTSAEPRNTSFLKPKAEETKSNLEAKASPGPFGKVSTRIKVALLIIVWVGFIWLWAFSAPGW